MTSPTISSALLAAGVAIAAGLVGSFALMRRMTLAADALSHVALPGIGLALLLRIAPVLGAITALAAGALLVWSLERRTRLATETIIGVVFSAALAVGALLTTGEELIDALFGAPSALAPWELAAGLVGSTLVIAFILIERDRLMVLFVSADVARTAGIDPDRLSLYYLLAFALTVALGLRYLGALLMGSLLIIPAATARQLARNLNDMLIISVTTALVATLGGGWVANRIGQGSGPIIVIVGTVCFFAALAASRRETVQARCSPHHAPP